MLRWSTGNPRIERARLLPLAERVLRLAAREEERPEQEVRGRVARVRFERTAQDEDRLGPVRKDVAGRLARGEREVRAPGAAEALLAVAAVVGDERVVLRQDRPGLGGRAGGRVGSREESARVVPEADGHVVDGHSQHPFGVRGEVRPERRVAGAEQDPFVPEQRAGRVLFEPVTQPRLRLLPSPEMAQQGHLHASGTDDAEASRRALRARAAGPSRGSALAQPRSAARWSRDAGRTAGSVAAWSQAKRAFWVSPRNSCGEAQVVERLAVVARARDSPRQVRDGLGVALEADREAARRPAERHALGEGRERGVVGVVRFEPLAVQLLVAAELQPVALAPPLRRRKDVRRLRSRLHVGPGDEVVAVLGVRQQHASLRVADLDGVRALGREIGGSSDRTLRPA